uniref:UMP-CMP kinase n=1 Tax=Spongospora subterranea TaxID=70186 RepID=A0A0H5RM82_9EUKA|eukprot:CRZ09814.1 hypothetical protein [Spongospora subterranea]
MPLSCFPGKSSSISKAIAHVVFVLGGPGSGKGTQCARIVTEFGYVHLSAGDLLREERAKPESTNGQLIDKCIKEGSIVPVEVTIALLKGAIESNVKAQGAKRFLVDGFPRNKDNLDGWNKTMKEVNVDFVLFLDCDQSVMEQRLLSRSEISGRADDNIESIRKRFITYQESTKPIIDLFEKIGKLRQVSSNGSVDEVFAEISKVFTKPAATE